ncbi:unnamed protein product, partial [Strongylus vulgaris]
MGRHIFGMKDGPEYLRMLYLEKQTGKSLINKSPKAGTLAAEAYFEQKLDHFDTSNTNTWKQVSNDALPFVAWAKKFGAIMFCLEHRFYGQSRPTPNQSVENLKYLSSRQALKDLEYFIESMNAKHNLKNPKWITFGGSYPGALSLWARQAYPKLIAGAVGSSAPVNAVVDFWAYLEVVENALRTHSNDCAENVRKGFEAIEDLLRSPQGRDKLSKIFVLKPTFSELGHLTYNDIQNFYSIIYGNFQYAVQYSEDNTVSTPFDHTSNNYTDMIDYLKVEEFGNTAEFDSSFRSWFWQKCTEFGYYQSTDGGPRGIFGSSSPLTIRINICNDAYGSAYNSESISKAVHNTQMHYGGSERYRGTNVVIPNGSIDPWHALGKYTSNHDSVVPFLINGTAHCADMYPPSDKDKPDLKRA